jgi:hypothetical protein
MKKINNVINTQWSIKVEGKLNRNNIIFHTNKYQKLYQKLKKYNDFIKKPKELYETE